MTLPAPTQVNVHTHRATVAQSDEPRLLMEVTQDTDRRGAWLGDLGPPARVYVISSRATCLLETSDRDLAVAVYAALVGHHGLPT